MLHFSLKKSKFSPLWIHAFGFIQGISCLWRRSDFQDENHEPHSLFFKVQFIRLWKRHDSFIDHRPSKRIWLSRTMKTVFSKLNFQYLEYFVLIQNSLCPYFENSRLRPFHCFLSSIIQTWKILDLVLLLSPNFMTCKNV